MRLKLAIHPSLTRDNVRWLRRKADEKNVFMSDLLEEIMTFYQENAEHKEKYNNALFMIDEIVKERIKGFQHGFEDVCKEDWNKIITQSQVSSCGK